MALFAQLKSGYQVIIVSVKDLLLYPKLIVPIVMSWFGYAAVILASKYYLPWNQLRIGGVLVLLFAVIFTLSMLVSISCLIMLSVLKQIQEGQRPSLLRATFNALIKDLYKAFPIVLCWAIIWFVLEVIDAILHSKERSKNKNDSVLSAENAAKTLSGLEPFSWSSLSIKFLEKGVRMVAFLIFPSIVWENKNPTAAVKSGFGILKTSFSEFAVAYTLTGFVTVILTFPLVIFLSLVDQFKLHLPPTAWVVVIIYSGITWSFTMYLEQMFVAKLYLSKVKKDEGDLATKFEMPSLD